MLIKRLVERSGLYLGVLGMRYGAVDESTGFSMTELEYRQAEASGKPVHVFVLDPKAPITVDMVETDPQRYAKLLDFRRLVMEAHTVG